MATLYDAYGRPVNPRELTREVGFPTLAGLRTVWTDTVASGLTPERLTSILQDAVEGDAHAYLTLAEEMEEREWHYISVLGTRKRAITAVEPTVEAATDAARDVEMADAVRELVRRPEFGDMVDDLMDALGKGYSAVEIVWDRSERQWWPRYAWRDPRFFRFDRASGQELRLLDEAAPYEGVALAPYKWIVHRPRLKTGLPIRGGLARFAAWIYLFKNYDLKAWMTFAEVFGMPLRLGKYGADASEEDIQVLLRAVANIGTDAAAVIPQSMEIQFVEAAKSAGGDALFKGMAEWLDRQTSKAVLGQTATTEGTAGKLGNEEAQQEVRRDILRSDVRQLMNTLNRDLVRPFIDLNFGPQPAYPRILLQVTEPEDLDVLSQVLERLVPLGLDVETSVIRDKLGLPDPPEGAKVLGPSGAGPAVPALSRARHPCPHCGTAINRVETAAREADEDELGRAAEALAGEWERLLGPRVERLIALAEETGDLVTFRDRLAELLDEAPPAREALARAGFTANLLGRLGAQRNRRR